MSLLTDYNDTRDDDLHAPFLVKLFVPLQYTSLETVMYLNLRVGRESMNHAVLSADLLRDASSSTRTFRQDEYAAAPAPMIDYRHVPLMDQEEPLVGSEMI